MTTWAKNDGSLILTPQPGPPPKPPLGATCACGQPWRALGEIVETSVGHFSPPGLDHDNNCMTRMIVCAGGHGFAIGLRRSCSTCDWRGKSECCGSFAYVDAWPDVPA